MIVGYLGRFFVGVLLGIPVAALFFWKMGSFDRTWAVGILIFFGFVAVVFWRWLGLIADAVFNPINWSGRS